MGQSTDAIHFYGYCSDSEDRIPWPWSHTWNEAWGEWERNDEDDDDYDEDSIKDHLYTLIGGAPFGWDAYEYDKRQAYVSVRDAALLDYFGVEFEFNTHCSGDYPMDLIAIKETYTVAARGCPVRGVETQLPDVKWVDAFVKLADLVKRPQLADPENLGWWLCSDWC